MRFKHTQEIHLEAYKQAKKQGAGFGLRWLEYAPKTTITSEIHTIPPGLLAGLNFKEAEIRKKAAGTWVTSTLFINEVKVTN